MKDKLCWFTTIYGGQVGVTPSNIRYLTSTELAVKSSGHVYKLKPELWPEHRKALVNGCL